jgi:YVTN family beta-propeller protein
MAVVLPLILLAITAGCGDDGMPADGGPDAADDGGDGGADAARDAGPSCLADEDDFPSPPPGNCEAFVLDPGATLPVGDDGAGGFIIPGGRRVTRAGRQIELSGFPMAVTPVPGSRFVVVSDGAVHDEQLSVIDVAAGTIVDSRLFREDAPEPESLFLGLAIRSDGRRLYASGGGADVVYVYDLDPATGALTDAPPIEVRAVGGIGYVSAIRLLPDDRTLLINLLFAGELVVLDTMTSTELGRIGFEEASYPYDLVVTPDGRTAYVSLWNGAAVVPVDVGARTAGAPIVVGKNPEGMVLSRDATRLVVTNSDSDSFSVIDLTTSTVEETVFLRGETAPRGSSPAAGAFDAAGRLYVASAGENAIDVFEEGAAGWARVGRLPTMWYPTDVEVLADGTLLVVNGKHEGTGPSDGSIDIEELIGGSLQIHDPGDVTDDDLRAWDMEITANNERGRGFVTYVCEEGGPDDFPIPRPGEGPSRRIEHVIVVVRENKTYDAYLGNLEIDGTPHGNSDPTLTLVPPAETAMVYPNTQELARTFVVGDNFYSQAEQSIQGHIWTTFGRTTDFVERSWHTTWGRRYWTIPPAGVGDPIGYPEEGGIFEWLADNGVEVDNLGEIVSARRTPLNPMYPGLVYTLGIPDIDRAEYVAGRIARCDLRTFTYMLLPRDHTRGLDPGAETPRSMMADNDDAVGRLIHALSHST